ncbi:MAG: glycosyltransferase [Kiritimatiellae bacterium]|nr:glycosyltransferase [Kiritimatiellia bacterium]MDW8457562.1 glycosyltransferase family 2 protein [Verrucomicrobiota bacterium]
MKISVITPNFNGARHLEECLRSVHAQRQSGVQVEHIVVDGGSTDGSLAVIEKYKDGIDHLIVEPDKGPADAINKGFRAASGDWVAWLNADDAYSPGALVRVAEAARKHHDAAFLFGRCRIVDEQGAEIRRGITRFKELFFPISSRFVFQCINYISQPASFFRRSAVEAAGPLRLDLKAAFDYEFLLRLWRVGAAARIPGPPLADFRWHAASISGQHFVRQFREEFEAARADAGRFAPQTAIHWFVRWGIVGCYTCMAAARRWAGGE